MMAWFATRRMRWNGAPVLIAILGATMYLPAFFDMNAHTRFELYLRSVFLGVGYALWALAPLLAKVEAPRLVRIRNTNGGILIGDSTIAAADVVGFSAVSAIRGWTVAIQLRRNRWSLRDSGIGRSFFLELSTKADAVWLAHRLEVAFPIAEELSFSIPRAWLPRASIWSFAVGSTGIVLLLLVFARVLEGPWALAAIPSILIALLGTASILLEPLLALRITWSARGTRVSRRASWTRAMLNPTSDGILTLTVGTRSFRIDPTARAHKLAVWQVVHPETPEKDDDGPSDLPRLRRQPGEELAMWLARLDAVAGDAYRSAAPGMDDLWLALRSNETTCEARLACARLLHGVYGVRPFDIESRIDDLEVRKRVVAVLSGSPNRAAARLEGIGPLVLI